MSEFGELPFHPTIPGLQAIGIGKRGPWWPIMGGSGDGDGAGGDGGAGAGADGGDGDGGGTATGSPKDGDADPKPTETVEYWKSTARDWETRSKANSKAAARLTEATNRAEAAEAEAATVPAKVAEALKAHLVARHQIGDEDAELFLTAADPELLLKQVDRLLGQSDKRRKNNNYVPGQGANTKDDDGGKGLDRQFVRDLFGNNN